MPESSGAFSFPEPNSVVNAEQTTNRLLHLQGRLHRLLWAADREATGDLVEESLEIIKTFLEILQAALTAVGRLPANCGVHLADASGTTKMTTRWPAGDSGVRTTECTGGDDTINRVGPISSTDASNTSRASSMAVPLQQHAARHDVSDITAQQALTCYSFMLIMLDRVVNVLTSSDYGSATGRNDNEPSSATLSLGFFNLATQPALQAKVILHLMLRMVERLRMLIQMLVSGCKDIEDRSSTSSSSIGAEEMPRKAPSAATSIAVSSHAIADLVSEREKLLVERLSCSTGTL